MILGKSRQRGLSFVSVVFLLVCVGFLAMIALKVAPIYANSFTIKSALKSVAEDNLMETSVSNVYDKLSKRLSVNNISFITRENIHIAENGGRVLIEVNWEEQREVIGNLDVIATFSEQVEFDAR